MKKLVLLCIIVVLCVGQANAGMWEMNKATALQLKSYVVSPSTSLDIIGSLITYPNPNLLYGPMSGQVGFEGGKMYDTDGDKLITAEIFGSVASLNLQGTGYDGITSYFQNDNDNIYSIQLFYNVGGSIDSQGFLVGGTEVNSGNFKQLPGLHTSAYLTAPASNLDLSTIDYIGFRVQAYLGGGQFDPSQADSFHISVVPVPAAVILGILGIGVAGLKLRKHA